MDVDEQLERKQQELKKLNTKLESVLGPKTPRHDMDKNRSRSGGRRQGGRDRPRSSVLDRLGPAGGSSNGGGRDGRERVSVRDRLSRPSQQSRTNAPNGSRREQQVTVREEVTVQGDNDDSGRLRSVAVSTISRRQSMTPDQHAPRERKRSIADDSSDKNARPRLENPDTNTEDLASASAEREERLKSMRKTEKGNARHKRMFGMLQGTLQKAQKEVPSKTEQKFLEVERKMQQKQEEESEERKNLIQAKRTAEAEVAHLRRVKLLKSQMETDAVRVGQLKHSIRLSSEPRIFFRPAKACAESDALLAKSASELEAELAVRQTKREREMQPEGERREEAPMKEDEVPPVTVDAAVAEGESETQTSDAAAQGEIVE